MRAKPESVDTPSVSVLLSTYNGGPYVEEALGSVLSQTLEDFELLVIDDSSSDRTADIIRSIRDPRIEFWESDARRGLFRNLNKLAQRARGPLLKFWCQDDVMLPNCLSAGVELQAEHPQLGCFYGACINIDERGRSIDEFNKEDETPLVLTADEADWFALIHGCLAGNLSNMFVPTEKFKEVGGFRDNISGDFDLMVRLQEAHPLGRISQPITKIRGHRQQWSKANASLIQFLDSDHAIYETLIGRLVKCGRLESIDDGWKIVSHKYARTYGGVFFRALLGGKWSYARQFAKSMRKVSPISTLVLHWLLGRVREFGR